MMSQRTAQTQILLCLCFLLLGGSVIGAEDLAGKCAQAVTKLQPCLIFATGKAAAPTKPCCDEAASIKDSNPECLCYIIQQTHKGGQEIKNFGLQEAKLLQLPSACKLTGANISDCPRHLGLAANSPDAAIFTNASLSASPASTANSSSSSTMSQNDSLGSMLKPHHFVDVMAVASAILLLALPTSGFLTIFT